MSHPIAKHLYAISASTGESFFRLYDDWLALVVAAHCRDEATYMKLMGHYGPRIPGKDHPADHFAKALGEFLRTCQTESALGTPFPDTLGKIYEEEAAINAYAGQFFTPHHLCRMMVQMTVEPTQKPISIADPDCGSGRFFIEAQPLAPKATFYGTDRDLTCVHMTALNMLVRNADAYIVHGNTLSMEVWGGYVTRSTPFGGEIFPMNAARAHSILVSTAEAGPAAVQPPRVSDPAPATSPLPEQPPEPQAKVFTADKKGQMGFDF